MADSATRPTTSSGSWSSSSWTYSSGTSNSWTSNSWTSNSWSTWKEAPTAAALDRFRARDSKLVRAEVAVQAVVFVVAVVGNVLVITALWLQARDRQIRRRRTLQAGGQPSTDRDGRRFHGHQHHGRLRLSRMDFMILHLTLADLSVAGFTVLPQLIWDALGQFPGNDVLCRSVAYLQVRTADCKLFASGYVYDET